MLLLSLFCETLLPTPRPSGTCKRGRCYAVFTVFTFSEFANNLAVAACTHGRCHAVFTWVNLQAGCRGHDVLTELAQMQRRCYAMCIVIQQWKLQIRQKTMQKVVKSQMLAMFIFIANYIWMSSPLKMWCCTCMGNTIKACFFNNTFLQFCIYFCKKMEQWCRH